MSGRGLRAGFCLCSLIRDGFSDVGGGDNSRLSGLKLRRLTGSPRGAAAGSTKEIGKSSHREMYDIV